MDMTVITQLYCQLYITCQLHVSANTIFGHHQVGYNYRRKLHNILFDTVQPSVYIGVDGWIILGWISRRWDVGIWTGLGWPRIGKNGGCL